MQVDEAAVLVASYQPIVVIHQIGIEAVLGAISIPKSDASWPSAIRLCFKPGVHMSDSDHDAFTKSLRHGLSGGTQWLH